jgi:peptidoglycan hydrolase-like protein with peptidoglycan-binding domain
MNRERLHEYDDDDRDVAAPDQEEATPGKHTFTENLRPMIAHSVGAGGRNEPGDVAVIQTALARRGFLKAGVDRVAGPRTIGAIRKFQATLYLHPDGLVEVDRKTERSLRQALEPSRTPGGARDPKRAAGPQAASEPAKAAPAASESDEQTGGDPRGKLGELHPTLQAAGRALLAQAQRRGLSVFIFEGMRDIARQDALYAQGRTAPGKVVTWVKGGGSYHNYGLAIDVVFQGPAPWGEQHDWDALGECGEAAGLEWGGRWAKADRPHFQLRGFKVAELKTWHADGGMENVWRQVSARGDAPAGGQRVAETYDEDEEE